jgi:hypothetical protein
MALTGLAVHSVQDVLEESVHREQAVELQRYSIKMNYLMPKLVFEEVNSIFAVSCVESSKF